MDVLDWTLVTGGAKGLGKMICLRAASLGMPVLVHYRTSRENALEVVEVCRQYGVQADLIQGDFSNFRSTDQFTKECLSRFKRIKNLINNVGNYLVKPASETSSEEWNQLFQINVNAPFALVKCFLPTIIETKGNILNIGVVGINNIRADVHRTAYTASKMALLMLTKSLARELAPQFVRVNMVSPGFLESAIDLPKDLSILPLRAPASFEDVTRIIAILLSEDSKHVTGQNIEVGGGIGLVHG